MITSSGELDKAAQEFCREMQRIPMIKRIVKLFKNGTITFKLSSIVLAAVLLLLLVLIGLSLVFAFLGNKGLWILWACLILFFIGCVDIYVMSRYKPHDVFQEFINIDSRKKIVMLENFVKNYNLDKNNIVDFLGMCKQRGDFLRQCKNQRFEFWLQVFSGFLVAFCIAVVSVVVEESPELLLTMVLIFLAFLLLLIFCLWLAREKTLDRLPIEYLYDSLSWALINKEIILCD